MILRSLLYSWRTNLGVALAAGLATGAITGALLIGDSVRHTLLHDALARLGEVHLAMQTGDHYFTELLAHRLSQATSTRIAPALLIDGMASRPGEQARAGQVNIIGIDERFVEFGHGGPDSPSDQEFLWINRPLADRLKASVGDTLLLRMMKPSALSRDMPLGSAAADTVSIRLQVTHIVETEQWPARFSLRAEQTTPLNAFVSLRRLQETTGLVDRANIIVSQEPTGIARADMFLTNHVREQLRPADGQLVLRRVPGTHHLQLQTTRVFLDPSIQSAIERITGYEETTQFSTTYFVNQIRHADRSTPYSMVTAFHPGASDLLPDDMTDDQIVLTQWLAEDLAAGVGDQVRLKYYKVGDGRSLEEHEHAFTVRAIVPTEAPGGDRDLMPEFPGLSDVDSPLDWHPPADLKINLSHIRRKDEAYWDDHRGAPKAFVTLNWATAHWSTRFGAITAIRWTREGAARFFGELEPGKVIVDLLDPAALGLFFRDVRTPALKAAEQSFDFGQLFIGLSFFVVAAAAMLTTLMFAFGIEQRASQVGMLLALGFTPARVRAWLGGEGLALAVVGAALGLPLGILYTRGMLWGLENLWHEAIGPITLQYHARPISLVIGAAAGIMIAVLSMAWVLQKHGSQPVRALLAARYGMEPPPPRAWRHWPLALAGACIGGAIALAVWTEPQQRAGAFFGAGALLLAAGLSAAWSALGPEPRSVSKRRSAGAARSRLEALTIQSIGWRNSTRRRGRSLATIAMLACGTFLLVAVNAFRHDPTHAPESATLGFELFGQSTIPISYDLNFPAGREALALDEDDLAGASIVQARLLEGDEASCLNLNRPQNPPLLGVDPRKLGHDLPAISDAVPALVDETVAQWVLRMKVGDELEYLDERGQPFHIRIAALLPRSILQGYIVIAEDDFKQRFPSQSGYRVFLVDAPASRADGVRNMLERALADYGMIVTPSAQRLAMFNAVENTYLSIFSVLGGLGVLLGCAGLALVLGRNVLERRSELALMRAVGFSDGSLRRLLLAEHWGLVAIGLLCGVVSAFVAVLPSLRERHMEFPYVVLALILGAIALAALLWTAAAAALALRGRLIAALRSE